MNFREFKCLFLIFMIFLAACIETDIYLPAFADMMDFFAVSEDAIQSLLTWNFLGICVAGPLYGPVSDAVGRKKPLLLALGLFLLGSLLTVFAEGFQAMLWGRVLQGLGSGGCFTLGTAIIFDAFQEDKAVVAVARLNSVVPFLLAGAPLLGGYLNQLFGFRANFLAIALCVAVSFAVTFFYLDETLAPSKRVAFSSKKLLHDFKCVAICRPFWQLVLVVSLLLAGYIAFLSCSAVLFVVEFGVSKQAFPLFQASVLGAWLVASLACGTALRYWGKLYLKLWGSAAVAVGGIGFALSAWLAPENPYFLTAPMVVFTFGVNWLQGLYFPEAMDQLPNIKGITASLLTSVRLFVAAAVVGAVSACYDRSIYPLMIAIVGVTCVTIPTIAWYERVKACRQQQLQKCL